MDQYKENFAEEALEVIADMEKCLLLMEASPNDPQLIQQVFGAMHTLKGNSSMFGYKAIADFTHHLESIYEYVRSGQKTLNKEILDLTLSSLDHLTYLIESNSALDEPHAIKHNQLIARGAQIVKDIEQGLTKVSGINPQINSEPETDFNNYQISFSPNRDIFYYGSNPLYFLEELQSLGTCIIKANLADIPALEEIDPTHCYISWDIYLTTEVDTDKIKEIFAFAQGRCELEINRISLMEDMLKQQIVEEDDQDYAALLKNTSVLDLIAPKKNAISSIRVPSERLDTLMNLVSELMTLQAKLGTITDQYPNTELLSVTENLEKISTNLRDNAFNMCLVPIKNMITPFNRMIRDLAYELGKEIEFVTEGIETELDKNIMEGLSDPLMHLLRNSIDHGIEAPDIRVESGKKKSGTILFKAFCAGTNVFIEIHDDGKGINIDKIKEKALQKGIIGKDEILSEKEILNLIFLPGFTTAGKISEISGRGVGMDVVKRKIEEIRGQIKIYSRPGLGTSITIKLPITVSIIDGLLVKVNDSSYVIPLSAVERCYEGPAVSKLNFFNNLIVLDGEQIPFISLSQEFDGKENLAAAQEIVLVNFEEKKVALIVERIIGKFQAVLKPLGRYFLNMENISGATILGDGKIALVLDTNKVAEQHLHRKYISV